MLEWFDSLGFDVLFTAERVLVGARVLLTVLLGLVGARLLSTSVVRLAGKRLGAQESMLLRRLVFYSVLVLVALSALGQLGINLGVLLGAAGILTVAIGFASQTSASNLISGLFLIGERPFVVGDFITVEGVTGEVLSVDLLSIKLRTFDNLLVRIPNETLIKTRLTNLTHFPIRRVDLQVGVAYKESLGRVRELLFEIADRNPLCLDQPSPLFIFNGFGDSSLNIQFSVWGRREAFLDLRNSIQLEIKQAFDEAGIEIPFPHRTLYTGALTDPLPVQLVGDSTPGPDEGDLARHD